MFVRNKSNPLITASNLPYPANAVFNAGAAFLGDKIVLILRVESKSGRSHLTVARSFNGISDWSIEQKPLEHEVKKNDKPYVTTNKVHRLSSPERV